jgi:hypothetical protein
MSKKFDESTITAHVTRCEQFNDIHGSPCEKLHITVECAGKHVGKAQYSDVGKGPLRNLRSLSAGLVKWCYETNKSHSDDSVWLAHYVGELVKDTGNRYYDANITTAPPAASPDP